MSHITSVLLLALTKPKLFSMGDVMLAYATCSVVLLLKDPRGCSMRRRALVHAIYAFLAQDTHIACEM